MNINELSNETISKLNRNEIGFFGLFNKGVYTYKGLLKSRKQGYKTQKGDMQVSFIGETHTVEMIKIQSLGDEAEYAMRVYDNYTGEYVTDYSVLAGCDFFK